MKKILLLGGSAQQIIAIKKARKMGYDTIVCDYLPDNPGQYEADRFYKTSTTDKPAILRIAKQENIDGILAYASDPAAPTAAYVAEKMDLPTNPYKSVEILCNKDKFRVFLKENGFNAPKSCGYESVEEAVRGIEKHQFPLIIKPVDSSGSKGVTVLYQLQGLEQALKTAFSFSRSGRVIIEEFIEKKHPYLIGGDIFVAEGKVVLWGLMNCYRDSQVNPLVPVGKSYPPEISGSDLDQVKDTLQSMVNKLQIRFGAMNVELVIDRNDKVWPIDIGPRNGGNMIPDLLGLIFNVDVVEMTIRAAMGEKVSMEPGSGISYYATYNLHSDQNGIFEEVSYSNEIEPYIVRKYIYKRPGDQVEYFDNAAKAVGILFLKFHNKEEMEKVLLHMNEHIKINLTPNP